MNGGYLSADGTEVAPSIRSRRGPLTPVVRAERRGAALSQVAGWTDFPQLALATRDMTQIAQTMVIDFGPRFSGRCGVPALSMLHFAACSIIAASSLATRLPWTAGHLSTD